LSVSYEKLVTDAEVLNMVAELCAGAEAGDAEIGLDALEEVAPGGHFFASAQTMARYQTEFYEPVVHDYANFGTWTERGSKDASTRARDVWQGILANPSTPVIDMDRLGALQGAIARLTAKGGALPES
jgi:trimethylamine--corrinoid protein Co-methyltransferase